MNKYFESSLISSDGKSYRVDLYGENYVGLNGPIIGGSGSVFYLAYDWIDYLQNNQALSFGDTTISAAYKARVLADGGTFENEDCLKKFLGETDTVVSFTYNVTEDRTEITLANAVFGTQTIIKNDVTNAASFVPVFNPKIIDISTEWQDVEEYIVSPLMPSETTISYANVEENRSSVDTAFFDRFLESYLQSDDDELKVAVYSVDGTATLEWAGNLVVDLIEWSNESSPREYTFKAIDGINRLKDIFYEGDLNSLSVLKVIDVIKDVLTLNGLTYFWGNADGYIAEAIEYESPNVINVGVTNSILDYTYIPENLLIPKNTDNSEVDFMTAYDVLYGILELFSCKMVHTEGRYWITQVRNYDGSNFVYRLFNKVNNTYTTTSKVHLITDLRVQSGGKFTYFFGINRVSIETENSGVNNIGGIVNNWDLKSINSGTEILVDTYGNITNPSTLTYNVGKVLSGNRLTVDFIYSIYSISASGLSSTTDLTVKLYITDDLKFIKGNSSTLPYWDENAITPNPYWTKTVPSRSYSPIDKTLSFTTPNLPFDLDNAVVTLEFSSNINGSTPLVYTRTHNIRNLRVLSPVDGGGATETIYCENTNIKFTKNLELGNLIINEGDALINSNNLSVHTNYNTGGTATIDAVKFWDGDFEVEGTLSTLRVLEAMSLQFRPIERYLGGFVGDYSPIESINYNNKTFVCKRVVKDYGMDEHDGDWFESTSSRVGLGTNDDKHDETDGEVINEGLNIYVGNKDGVGILDETVLVAALTSLVVNLTEDVRIGDKLNILNYETKEILCEVIVTADASAGNAVTVPIQSFTPESQIPAGYEVVNAFKKLSTSEVYRFDTLQTTGVAGVPPDAASMLDGEIRFVGENIYRKDGEIIYRWHGSQYNP